MYIKDKNFSLWCDFIERDFLENEFDDLIKDGEINGVTSNPAIFKNAFLTSKAYNSAKKALKKMSPKEIYEALAIKDIQLAAKKLYLLYEEDDDGFVSIEVDPNICHDTKATIKEGIKLYEGIGYDNVMIKIPATNEGYEAMQTLMKEGINVNATLVFSNEQSQKCLEAMKNGLDKCKISKKPKGVISIFVSRFDRLLDPSLPIDLKGRVGIVNATNIYNMIKDSKILEVKALFASTGVKGNEYPADYYIKELCYPNSINTAPLETIKAYQATNIKSTKTPLSKDECDEFFIKLKKEGVDITKVSQELLDDGLKQFIQAYNEILRDLS